MAAINAAQAAMPIREPLPPVPAMPQTLHPSQHLSHQHGEVPTPPGMMDIEMDDAPPHLPTPANFLHTRPIPAGHRPAYSSAPPSPWATAFRPQGTSTPPQCLPPSLLSFNPGNPGPSVILQHPAIAELTSEQLQARALKKAQKKAERAAQREEASASDMEGEKKFPCPIEGCGKVYKQANGLKYHLTRSINSGHGNVAAMGGLAQFLDGKD